MIARPMEQERVPGLALLQTDDALKRHIHMLGLHMSVESIESRLLATVCTLPGSPHLDHPAPDQQVTRLVPLPHHHSASRIVLPQLASPGSQSWRGREASNRIVSCKKYKVSLSWLLVGSVAGS